LPKLVGALLILLVLAVLTPKIITLGLRGDPPSVYNSGGGGLTLVVSVLSAKGYRIKSVESVGAISALDPVNTVLFVLGPDIPLTPDEVKSIVDFASKGGTVVVMDESENVASLLASIGINVSGYSTSIDEGYCNIMNTSFTVLFNVYAVLSGGAPICWVGSNSVAVLVEVGAGKIYVFGDSSLFNNYMWSYLRGSTHRLLLNFLVSGFKVVAFYEAPHLYYTVSTPRGSDIVFVVIKLVSLVVQDIRGRVAAVIMMGFLIALLYGRPKT